MRVITGSARGRRLKTLENYDVRPTSDKVKEAVFSVIQFDIPEAVVLDLFSGSGQLGIESLSRGAANCVFVDSNKDAINIIKENVDSTGFENKAKILNLDYASYLKTCKLTFDIAFLDPPYEKGLVDSAMIMLCQHMSDKGIVICEHEKKLILPDNYGAMIKYKNYKYGHTEVTIFKNSKIMSE